MLVLIGLLFNIHAFALGGWTTGKGFVLLSPEGLASTADLDGLTGHEVTWLRAFTQETGSMKYAINFRFRLPRVCLFSWRVPRLPKPEIDQWQGGKRIAVLMVNL